MTHRPVRVEEDGTRVYAEGHRYTPVPPSQRKYAVRRPQDPRAVRWGGQWLLPLELLPEDARALPETRPDSEAYDHMSKPLGHTCEVCRRPEAERWRRKWRRDQIRMLSSS